MKTAKIQEIKNVREWSGQNGTVFYFDLLMDNGDTGSLGKKTRDAIHVGQELHYTVEYNDKGNKFKEERQPFGNGFAARAVKGSTASFALSYAKDIAVANIGKADKPIEMDALADKIIHTAAKFQGWLKENE